MNRRSYLAVIVLSAALLLTACITTPRSRAVTQDSGTDYALGLVVDQQMRVVAIAATSAATNAGVEVGDQLVSLTWVLSEAPADLPAGVGSAEVSGVIESEVVTDAAAPLRPPPGVEYKTIPFTQSDKIREMISYGVPLRLEIVRQDEKRAVTIVPLPRTEQSELPANVSGMAY